MCGANLDKGDSNKYVSMSFTAHADALATQDYRTRAYVLNGTPLMRWYCKVLLRAETADSAGTAIFHHIFTLPRAHLKAEPCTSYSEIWSCTIKFIGTHVVNNQSHLPLTPLTYHQHCTHSISNPHSVHIPHVLRGNMYSHGQYVGT